MHNVCSCVCMMCECVRARVCACESVCMRESVCVFDCRVTDKAMRSVIVIEYSNKIRVETNFSHKFHQFSI